MHQPTVPLFAPSPSQLRAGAVWVTISNWADALAERYGGAEVVTPAGRMTPEASRDAAWTDDSDSRVATTTARRPAAGELARTLAKDVRWAWWASRATRHARNAGLDDYRSAPFVWQHHDLFARSGFVVARRLGLPVVLFVDAPQVWEARQWGIRRPGWGRALEMAAERPQLEGADVVACVSDEVADQVSRMTSGRARVLVTPCTASPPAYDERDHHRRALGLEERFVIGWVGSFRRFHHADALVRLAAGLKADGVPATLMMLGDGPTRQECSDLASALDVDSRFVGSVRHEQVAGLLQACDVGVVPSAAGDAFHYSPLKLKEFLAAGLPTVVPYAGEMARLLTGDLETLFYDPGDERRLSEQVLRLARDDALRAAMARRGSQLLAASFSLDDQIDQVEQLLPNGEGIRR